jgi:hypothetical protein
VVFQSSNPSKAARKTLTRPWPKSLIEIVSQQFFCDRQDSDERLLERCGQW